MTSFNVSNRLFTRMTLTAISCLLAQKATAGTLGVNFNVSGTVPSTPVWYDNGTKINDPSNNPNLTIGFTFGAGALAVPDSAGIFTTDSRHEALHNPGGLITAFTAFNVTLPSNCKIGTDTTANGTITVDASMSINIAGISHILPTSPVSAAEKTALITTSTTVPGLTTGALVYLQLANLQQPNGRTGPISCTTPGNFTLTF